MHLGIRIAATLLFGLWTSTASSQQGPVVPGAEKIAQRAGAPSASEGRVLISELGCVACHDLPTAGKVSRKKGPNLRDVGSRISPAYLRTWLADPHATKPGTVMPDLTSNDSIHTETIDALTAFLSRDQVLSITSNEISENEEIVAQGGRLYHSVGCVACHDPFRKPSARIGGDDEFSDDIVEHREIQMPGVGLPDFASKTSIDALTDFLLDPLAVRPSGRMPNMKLNPGEAKAIAAYLFEQSEMPNTTSKNPNPSLFEKGREAFSQLKCAACHSLSDEIAEPMPRIPIRKNDAGCLSSKRPASAPWYGLTSRQRKSIQKALNEKAPAEHLGLEEHLASLNCMACHSRDDLGGIEDGRLPYFAATIEADLGDEGRIPPTLTGVGAKLTSKGLSSMLVGDGSVRPYMATRMPQFGESQVGSLPVKFLELDHNPNAPEMDVSGLLLHHRNRYGRQLLGTDGFGCVECHNLYGAKSLGIPAIDLATIPDRIQPSWFKQFVLDPYELRPGTRMPTFFDDGESPIRRVLRGNVDQQIEAMWIYLKEIDQTRLPVGMEDRGNFELVPTERPIILRTFMKGIGNHAIAVGYPEGVHIAFDALDVRLKLAWRGQFMDAESTWADRFSPLASPLGEEQFLFPSGPIVATSPDLTLQGEENIQFRGYRLDKNGVPTFMYSHITPQQTVHIDERVEISKNGEIRRRFTFGGNRETTLYLMSPGKKNKRTKVPSSNTPTVIEHTWSPQW